MADGACCTVVGVVQLDSNSETELQIQVKEVWIANAYQSNIMDAMES
jgi:hypothetical protein